MFVVSIFYLNVTDNKLKCRLVLSLSVQLKPLNLSFNPFKHFGTADVSKMARLQREGFLAIYTTIYELFGVLTC